MPRALFRRKAEEAWARHDMKVITPNRVEEMPGVIDDLAGFFGVSREAAKLRMLEVGFESVAGVYVYIDGRYLRPHSWRAGTLARDETFSIPAEDAARLMVEDADFARAAQGYLYVEGHFVLDDPRYVTRGEDGALMLSDAARYHMDQCCLRFKVVLGGAQARYGEFCLLSQSAGIPLDPAYLSCSPEQQAEQLAEIRAERDRILGKIKASPEKAWKILIEWRETNQSELESVTGLARETINKLATGKTPGNKQTVLLMCFALQLPPEISKFMLGYSKNALAEENESENCCLKALNDFYMYPLPSILIYLENNCNIYLR